MGISNEDLSELSESDENIPLSRLKTESNSTIPIKANENFIPIQESDRITSIIEKTIQNNEAEKVIVTKAKRNYKKKQCTVKKNKRTIQRSGSESDDFEKYTYFDDSKVKRKIRIKDDTTIEELKVQMNSIKIENSCLKAERERINLIKFHERLKLRLEIKRLKSVIMDLNLENYLNDKSIPDVGNTTKFISTMNARLKQLDFSYLKTCPEIMNKVNSVSTTDPSFWKEFDDLESRMDENVSKPYWTGDLTNINCDYNEYFKPTKCVMTRLNLSNDGDNGKVSEDESDDETAYGEGLPIDNQDENQTEASKNGDEIKKYIENAEDHELCVECGHKSTWADFISRHREAYQNNVKLPTCDTCNMKFYKLGYFDGRHRIKRICHRQNIRSQSLVCDTCGQRFTTFSGLRQHQILHKEAVHSCPHCSYKCHRKGYLKVHMRTHLSPAQHKRPTREPNEESFAYSCDVCNFSTTVRRHLKYHKLMHCDERTYPCDLCPFVTKSANGLTLHIRRHVDVRSKKHTTQRA